jgi:radical SAM superfamily enzyme
MKINKSAELHAAIKELEVQEEMQKEIMVEKFHAIYESFKPINLLKSSLSKIIKSPDVVDGIINTTVGLGTGLLSKNLLIGKSAGIVKKLLGTAVELGVVGLVSKNIDSIKLNGLNFLSKIFKSKKTATEKQFRSGH